MSPEQAAGDLERLGPRSDVYSLGATLYCLLTGHPPIEGGDVDAVLKRAQRGDFPPPRSVAPATEPALEAICLRAMAHAKPDRYQTATALAEDMQRYLAGEPLVLLRRPE